MFQAPWIYCSYLTNFAFSLITGNRCKVGVTLYSLLTTNSFFHQVFSAYASMIRRYMQTHTHTHIYTHIPIYVLHIMHILRNGIFLAVSVTKGCHSHQDCSHHLPWENSRRKECLPPSSHQTVGTSLHEKIQAVKIQNTDPRKWRYISKEWNQWVKTLASFYTYKSAKFLNLRYLVFFH